MAMEPPRLQPDPTPGTQRDAGALDGLRQRVAQGFLYAHSRLTGNSQKTLEGLSFLYALIELLEEQGVVDIERLDERKHAIAERLAAKFKGEGQGALFQDPEHDKYDFQQGASIDCASRLHLCKAACCRLPFALSRQDIREGVIRWELGQPYIIEQDADGYCHHLDRDSGRCGVYAQRPVPCRGFDCRSDGRIWQDFGRSVVKPEVQRGDWPHCLQDSAGAGDDP